MEREVITQMSSLSMRRRNIRVKEDGQIITAVPLKYITSQKISADRKTIVLTAEDVPEAVCNALMGSGTENGYEVRVRGESCGESNTIEFVSETRLERNIQETSSLQCSGVAKEYACSGKDEYDDKGCRTREVLHCGSNQDCTCVGGGCSCVCREEQPNCADFDDETCACKRCNIGYRVSLGYCIGCGTTIPGCLQAGENCTCAECEAGYTYSDGKCSLCGMKGCLAYSSGCVCSSCDVSNGYRLIEGRCVKCENETSPQGLKYCVANQYDNACRCTSCQSGYKLLDGGCVSCDSLPGCTGYDNACGCTACNTNTHVGPVNGNCCPKKEGCTDY